MATTRSYLHRIKLKGEALARANVWPSNDPGQVRPNPWLSNFADHEADIAAALIDVFVYFPQEQVTQLLRRALTRLFQKFAGAAHQSLESRRDRINTQLSRSLFVPVEGETPNPTDSGNYICRCVRQMLELPESNIETPTAALRQYIADGKTIVFVDDMVGTGNQMRATWNRQHGRDNPQSFQNAYSCVKRDCYYVCLASCANGRRTISSLSGIDLVCAHELEDRDHFRAALARIPDHPAGSRLPLAIDALLAKYAPQLTLVKRYMRRHDHPIHGFGSLGLTLGFQHSIPDATLPIYWANGTGSWTPLSRRA